MREPRITASGLTTLARMPCGAPSTARHRARCRAAAFAVQYAAAPGRRNERVLAADEHDRSAAALLLSSRGTPRARRGSSRWPARRASAATSPSSFRRLGDADAMPAFETRMSSPPNSRTASANGATHRRLRASRRRRSPGRDRRRTSRSARCARSVERGVIDVRQHDRGALRPAAAPRLPRRCPRRRP